MHLVNENRQVNVTDTHQKLICTLRAQRLIFSLRLIFSFCLLLKELQHTVRRISFYLYLIDRQF
jgi:hypothetical protein